MPELPCINFHTFLSSAEVGRKQTTDKGGMFKLSTIAGKAKQKYLHNGYDKITEKSDPE